MHAPSIPGTGFEGNGLPDDAPPKGDRWEWCFAGPLIVATSLGLWAAIGEGIAVLIG